MRGPPIVALTLSLIAVALAGCTSDDAGGDGDGDDATQYKVSLGGVEETFPIGRPLGLSVHVENGTQHKSDHIGAHWWSQAVEDPTARIGDSQACEHTDGTLPGGFVTQCRFTHVGEVQLRGHARHDEGGDVEHWSDPHAVHVYPLEGSFQLAATRLPTQVDTGENFTFRLNITSPDGFTGDSEHIGAHWWTNATAQPTPDIGNSTACAHQAGGVPAVLEVSCRADESGTIHLRGHLRFTVQGEDHEYWTDAHQIQVG